MMSKRFLEAFKNVIGLEGGYSDNPKDRGNWTGGEPGKGELKGTKYGISAASYPKLDIKNLTSEQAKAIYYTDFWVLVRGDEIADAQIAEEMFDTGVNCGIKTSIRVAQRALKFLGEPILPDGVFGSRTLEKINKWIGKDPAALHKALNGYQFKIYAAMVEADPTQGGFAHGWLKRIQYYRKG